MNSNEVRVHAVKCASKRQPSFLLYEWPEMSIHEPATKYLSELAKRSSVAHQRNTAYALSHWHSYCLASDIDYRRATRNDVERYISASGKFVSSQTGALLADATIGQRVSAVGRYYEYGARSGWNLTASDLQHARSALEGSAKALEIHGCETHALPIGSGLAKISPRQHSESEIRALSLVDLTRLLDTLGPSQQQIDDGDRRSCRDRLIAEWLAYVGLRVSEALNADGPSGLTIRQIKLSKPDLGHPFDHVTIRVLGKGSKLREVAVPNWLAEKTIQYIDGERASATSHAKRASEKLFVAGLNSRPKDRGRPISVRAFQKAMALACMEAGLCVPLEASQQSDNKRVSWTSKYSPHDLRHTYAVMTYYAQRALGNPEPWKPIQAQLGHKHLSTTIDIYLAYVSVSGQWGKDLRRASVRELVGLGI